MCVCVTGENLCAKNTSKIEDIVQMHSGFLKTHHVSIVQDSVPLEVWQEIGFPANTFDNMFSGE